jgi:3-methyladenine DNA glycosylase AlkC
LINALTEESTTDEEFGLSGFMYMPINCFIAEHGLDKKGNANRDPFVVSMKGIYELTKRFSAEFAIRDFLIHEQARTLKKVYRWMTDANPHVRRLCSEGTRPKLPWARRLPAFIADPSPTLPILDTLKDDESLYVRRSVANHLGDIAKDHPEVVFDRCRHWLDDGAGKELRWVIRHALRYPAKQKNQQALKLRALAK